MNNKKGILVVDDQPGIRLLLTDVLENEGYKVTAVENGKQALEIIHKESFDLLVLDYKLPIIDGKEVLQQLEEQKVMIPAIIMSGLAENMEEEIKHFSIVKKVIGKPFNVNDLNSYVREIING